MSHYKIKISNGALIAARLGRLTQAITLPTIALDAQLIRHQDYEVETQVSRHLSGGLRAVEDEDAEHHSQ